MHKTEMYLRKVHQEHHEVGYEFVKRVGSLMGPHELAMIYKGGMVCKECVKDYPPATSVAHIFDGEDAECCMCKKTPGLATFSAPCGYCGSTRGWDADNDWPRCVDCGGC